MVKVLSLSLMITKSQILLLRVYFLFPDFVLPSSAVLMTPFRVIFPCAVTCLFEATCFWASRADSIVSISRNGLHIQTVA